jgi:hypothetical protein
VLRRNDEGMSGETVTMLKTSVHVGPKIGLSCRVTSASGKLQSPKEPAG